MPLERALDPGSPLTLALGLSLTPLRPFLCPFHPCMPPLRRLPLELALDPDHVSFLLDVRLPDKEQTAASLATLVSVSAGGGSGAGKVFIEMSGDAS